MRSRSGGSAATKNAAHQLSDIGQLKQREDAQTDLFWLLDYLKAHLEGAKYTDRFMDDGQMDRSKGVDAMDASRAPDKTLSKNSMEKARHTPMIRGRPPEIPDTEWTLQGCKMYESAFLKPGPYGQQW